MATRRLDPGQRGNQKEIENFIQGWSWKRVYQAWLERLGNFSVFLNPLFTEVWVHDPKFPTERENLLVWGRGFPTGYADVAVSWWQPESISQRQKELQRRLNDFPGVISHIHPDSLRTGEIDTLCYLWEHKEEPEKIAAILIAASLFSRIHSSRKSYPNDKWSPLDCVAVLSNWAYEKWFDGEIGFGWHCCCTEVLPTTSWDYSYKLDSMDALVRYLAEEHASVLSRYKPVAIQFKPECDPSLERILQEEREAEQKRFEEWRRQREREEVEKVAEEQRRQKEHPRWGEWRQISNKELQQLVWTKPARVLAKEFGISDVAIAKRCKAVGIPKPPRGFWAAVEAGKIPHPQGKPVKL